MKIILIRLKGFSFKTNSIITRFMVVLSSQFELMLIVWENNKFSWAKIIEQYNISTLR
jgi:hypothetical protein